MRGDCGQKEGRLRPWRGETGGQREGKLRQRCGCASKEQRQMGEEAGVQRGQLPHTGMALKISDVFLVAE